MARQSGFTAVGRPAVLAVAALACALWPMLAPAATKTVDLDGDSANGAESTCELNVVNSFPVQVENVVTNRTSGDAFDFRWFSAGPGGFTSSVAAGTSAGVGSKWTWTTNQTVYSFTGSTCATDICLLKTGGPAPLVSTCSLGCLDDGISLRANRGASPGEVSMTWSGGTATYTVFRSTNPATVTDPANAVVTTNLQQSADLPPAARIVYYRIRGTTCLVRKPCTTSADCNPATEGTCVSVGPFSVPGRSLVSTDVTVSAASLTSSLITFFSPPTEIFRVTSTAQPGVFQETLTNGSTAPVTVVTEAWPAGCCPADPEVPHRLRCGEECVDYLNDPLNCGACGNVCGEDTCCSNGNCASLCADGRSWCNGACVDFLDDNENCGSCGNVCGEGTCCSGGACVSVCGEGQTYCNGQCADLQDDSANCGSCGNVCGEGTCCNGGACVSVCADGETWCNGQCADLQDDSANCGSCGNVCGEGTCCNEGACASVCAEGQTYCNGQCVDFENDSANCGSCGNACGEGACCSGGTCVSVCEAGQAWCNGQCADFQNDSANCGSCGNVCGEGTCCSGGICASVCEAGRSYCDGLCYDLQNDPLNCGACGNVCTGESICESGTCLPCPRHAGEDNACDNRCVNLNTDPYNCGACGVSCNIDCPSGFKGVCSNGQSCRCLEGTPAPPPPPNTPVPTEPLCPNPDPSDPVDGVCPNPDPSDPVGGVCPNPDPSPGPVGGVCPNPDPSPGPVDPVCPDASPSWPVAGVCPFPGPPPPEVDEAPVCVVDAGSETIPAGGTTTICRPGGVLFKEVAAVVSVCGDTIPGPDGACQDGISNVSTGTYMRLVPDTQTTVGDAYLTPYAVHVTSDTSNDGLIEPGETVSLIIEVVNAGPLEVSAAAAVLIAPPVDLTDDGVVNPVVMTIINGSSPYGAIPGTQPSLDCEPLVLHPASNSVAFQLTAPVDLPGDTSYPFTLRFTGTVGGQAFSMDVPLALGIADLCDYTARTRDYDGLEGLSSPMAKLVPLGDAVAFPSKAFNAGQTRPLKLRHYCGGVNLRGADVDAAEIVGLSEATRGPLDISSLTLNDDQNSSDPFFRWNDSTQQWIYNMRTSEIGTGVFTLTIRIAGRKNYVTGFVLR